jgi:hypothetical protein
MRFVMNADMVYQYPIWAVGLLLVGAAVFGVVLLEVCARRLLPIELRQRSSMRANVILNLPSLWRLRAPRQGKIHTFIELKDRNAHISIFAHLKRATAQHIRRKISSMANRIASAARTNCLYWRACCRNFVRLAKNNAASIL